MPLSRAGTAYDLTGPKGAPVVVLIHGLGLNRGVTFGAMIPVLATRYRVLSYDLCGHGQSALPAERPSLSVLGAQVIALMDELGIECAALVGFSLGGMVNRRVAMDHSDRVSALCILNSPHDRGAERQALVEAQAREASAGGPAATIDAALERWFTPEFRAERPDVVSEVRRVVLANDMENYAHHRRVLAEGVVELIRPEPPIARPTLVMTCDGDPGQTPEMARTIGAEVAGSEVMILSGLRHMGLVEDPAYFVVPIVGFLGRVFEA